MKRMFRARWVFILFISFAFYLQSGVCSEKVYNAGVESKIIMQSTKTVTGQDMKYPEAKMPEVTCLRVKIPPGQETGWHSHTVPGYSYVISGVLTLEYANGAAKVFKAGDAFTEVVDTAHNGSNRGAEDVVLVAFFTEDHAVPFTKKEVKL